MTMKLCIRLPPIHHLDGNITINPITVNTFQSIHGVVCRVAR